MNTYVEKLKESKDYIKSVIKQHCDVGQYPKALIVLGSGLGNFSEAFSEKVVIPFESIPHFPAPSVSGHSGKIVLVKENNKFFLLQSGRLHYYEGHSFDSILHPIRCIRMLGLDKLILTNSAGSLNPNFKPGDLVTIKDHINFSGVNPLVGENLTELGVRFPDMSKVYNPELMAKLQSSAKELEVGLHTGTYFNVSGPSYETPAEVKLFFRLGGDMVGMSTVPEAIAAKHCGYDVLGISCITNYGAGLRDDELTHEDVQVQAAKVTAKFSKLVKHFILNHIS